VIVLVYVLVHVLVLVAVAVHVVAMSARLKLDRLEACPTLEL